MPSWTANLTKHESGRAKLIIVDSGMAMRVARLTARQLLSVENLESFGHFLEAMVLAELIRQQSWSQSEFEVFHFRDRDGWEVDAIPELADGGVIAVEIKASIGFRGDDFRGLRKMRDKLGARFIAGFVLNTGQVSYHYAERLYGLPVDALWQWCS